MSAFRIQVDYVPHIEGDRVHIQVMSGSINRFVPTGHLEWAQSSSFQQYFLASTLTPQYISTILIPSIIRFHRDWAMRRNITPLWQCTEEEIRLFRIIKRWNAE